MDKKGVLLALFVVWIWGVNFTVIKLGLEQLPPLLFSGLRFLIVSIPAIFFVPFPKTSVWKVLGVGFFLGVFKFGLLFVAMREDANAGVSSLLLQAQVVFTILLSAIVLKESVQRHQSIGVTVAILGFALFFTSTEGNVTLLGVGMILTAALFWGFSNLIMKQVGSVNLLHFMVWVSAIPPLPLFIASYYLESQVPLSLLANTDYHAWIALAYVSYLSTLVAFAIWGWLLQNYSAATVTPFALLIPVAGMLSAYVILAESLTTIESVGSAIILLGLSISIFGKRWMRVRSNDTTQASES